jgi:glyoxylase-like metal-dependent hydrolase (beta-lactamase superfamily II)
MSDGRVFHAGELTCAPVSDGELPYPAAALLANAPPEELQQALAGEVDENGMIVGRFNPLLVRGPDGVVLVDSGFGEFAPGPGAGRLPESLAAEGVEATNVDVVVLTHAHPDHLGGLIVDGTPAFPTARHVMLEREWQFWAEAANVPPPLAVGVEQALKPLHDLGVLHLIESGDEIARGVRIVHAPGHTPGHAVVELGEPTEAIFLADAVLHEAGFAHPEWTSPIDADPSVAVETRRALLSRAADEGLLVTAYHLGSQGRVERDSGAYRLVPETQ